MLKRIKITDNQKTSLNYLSEVFSNGTEFNFKPGINIMVGGNGCGKSTLMKLLYNYLLCSNSCSTQTPNVSDIHEIISDLFSNNTGKLFDGVVIEHDYQGVAFRLRPSIEVEGDRNVLSSLETFTSKYDQYHSSVGESMLNAMNTLFKVMFSKQVNYEFPIKAMLTLKDRLNETWKQKIAELLHYYKTNHVEITKEKFEYTVLMDEPDRNLDIDNITSVYNILSERKELTQIIAVVHNPILIYKLSKLDYINFIEVEPNYLYKVKNLIKAIK